MQQIGNHLSNFTQQNPHGPASLTDLPPNTVPKQPQRTQRMGTADKARLSETLGRVCALQREYGKSSAELETLVEGFAWAMAAYPVEDIIRAMGTCVLSHREIPTPSDLLDILRPPAPPPFKPDWLPVYIALRQRIADRYFPYRDERFPVSLRALRNQRRHEGWKHGD
jgi:hypothetical protein